MTNEIHRRLVEEASEIVEAVREDLPIWIAGKKYISESAAPQSITEPLSDKASLLDEAKRLITGNREQTYGTPRQNFTVTGQLWAPILDLDIVAPWQVALCMNQVKVARLIKTPNHRDGWVDAAGYLACGGETACTTAEQRP